MTIKEYRQELSSQMDSLLMSKGHFDTQIREGLRIALNLSEKLYDDYPYDCEEKAENYMTNRQLAMLLAKGYGQVSVLPTDQDGDYATFETHWTYFDEEGGRDNDRVSSNVRVREFGTQKWVEPTVEVFEGYMGRLPYPFYVN